ncbi:S9 family peptidase [bacterium]|nr:S9 family peptidase [bacterium]MBU1634893.1 S9 family peptidase [bacterium]MBU1872664.1 S9 family peptidase [bacterium]
MSKTTTALLLCLLFGVIMVNADGKRALTFDDLVACKRLKDPRISPDGQLIAFTVQTMNEPENNSRTDIYLVSNEGKDLRQFSHGEKSASSLRWSPDGRLAYLSGSQIWIHAVEDESPTQLTSHYTGVDEFIWSPDGQLIAFASRVYPDCADQTCTERRDKTAEDSAVKARVYDDLLYRHWDTWWDHKRSHLFVLNVKTGEFKDVTPGDYDVPPVSLSSGFAFSPDSKVLVFTSNHDKLVAASTDNDVWMVPVDDGELELLSSKCKDRDFSGNDSDPQFSPDGRYLSFLSMNRAGFEADKPDLIVKDMKRGKFTNLTADKDIRIDSYRWLPDSKSLLLRVDEKARLKIKRLDMKSGQLVDLISEGNNRYISISGDGKQFAYLHERTTKPYELYIASTEDGTSYQLTHFNTELLADVDMNNLEEFWFKGANNDDVHGFIIKPPLFDSAKQYPAVFFVHGGPQGAWQDEWHYRWNVQMWAAQGYVMVMINPRGSTGYGQEFTDGISKDWGGKVFEDLIAGQTSVLGKFKFIDKNQLAAAGASYGGYMMNWIEGHMDAFPVPFKTLVNHDGTFNLYTNFLTTEELWFPEWEFNGPYWEDEQYYQKWSPHNYVNNFKTPMLIIHGEHDYRLAYTEGLMPFTALRRKGIPAKLVIFPDETHFVSKPQNSRFWHQTIFEWLDSYIK